MSFIELLLLAVGLSMDAFAVSICKGLALKNVKLKHMAIAGAWFGGFQMLMPLIGYLLGSAFSESIQVYDHWVAFGLLALIGVSMVREAFGKEEDDGNASMDFKTMLLLAIATSIDALAVGISLAFVGANLTVSMAIIGTVTFLLSAAGVKIGSLFGDRYQKKAELTGGIILVLLGLKILLEHLGVF